MGDSEMNMSANQPVDGGPLAGIRARLKRFNDEIHEIAHKLEQHAVAVHGANAIGGGGEVVKGLADLPDGALPAIHHALDEVESAISRIALAAGANSTLA
jgi:hypothetical protein